MIRNRFYYLTDPIEWREFRIGETVAVPETNNMLELTPFPVYHGPSAPGAILLLAEVANPESANTAEPRKAVFTGDVLTPLLRAEDYNRLRGANVLFADACTRFPSPSHGHWSVVDYVDGVPGRSKHLSAWLNEISRNNYKDLIKPHQTESIDPSAASMLDEFVADLQNGEEQLCCGVLEFVERLAPATVELVHYSGYEENDWPHPVLTDPQLLSWVESVVRTAGNTAKWNIPRPGHRFKL